MERIEQEFSTLSPIELTLSEQTFIGKIASPLLRYERWLVGFRIVGRQQ
jgi:hypothetical protein